MPKSFNNVYAISAGFLISGIASAQVAGSGPVDLVDALNGVFGKHAGMRASHAKGVCVAGSFTPNAQAEKLSSASFLAAKKIPLMGRFSVGGGNPKASDKGKTVRGLALRFGDVQQPALDLVLLSAPVFMVATPDEFVGFMKARAADPATGKPDPSRIKAFNDANPSTRAQIEYLNNAPVTPSYAQSPYWGVNAFRFINAAKQTAFGR